MLFYLSSTKFSQTLAPVVIYFRPDLQKFVRFVPYEQLPVLAGVPRGAVVWTDFDRLDRNGIARASAMHNALSGPEIRHFNDPAESLQRFALLERLAEAGVNSFRVYRLADADKVRNFPVFIRAESGVARKQPALLATARELADALKTLRPSKAEQADMMIVEYLDARGQDGIFRKYGAYRVGDRILAQHILFSRGWFVKNPNPIGNRDFLQEHHDYVAENPHARDIMRVFEIAGIEYGRIDYCMAGGRMEVFEINTNPAVLNDPPTPFDDYDYQVYADQYVSALLSLPGATDPEDLSDPTIRAILEVHERVLAGLRWKFKRRRAKATLRLGLKRLRRAFG